MPDSSNTLLSKTGFLAGLECERRLWFDEFDPTLAKPLSEAERAILLEGQTVGKFAHRCYPGGVIAYEPGMGAEEAAARTQALLAEGHSVLFEATFLTEDRLVRCDVFRRLESGGWAVDEVKASSADEGKGPKEEYLKDLAFQFATLRQAGYPVESAGLVMLNRSYVWDGQPHDPNALFLRLDLTAEVIKREDATNQAAEKLVPVLRQATPPVVVESSHCKQCPYSKHCLRNLPPDDVLYLPYANQRSVQKLRAQGYQTIRQIPDGVLTDSRMQPAHRALTQSGRWVNESLPEALATIQFPAVFIDFEAHQPAIPIYPGTRPYATICFQWSAHRLDSPEATPEHKEFLFLDRANPTADPRPSFIQSLWQAIADAESIVIYSAYEITQVRAMAAAQIPFAQQTLDKLLACVVDIEKIVKENVYLEQFKYRTSIKTVLPALVPEMSYDGMEIGDGAAAMVAYRRLLSPAVTDAEASRTVANLLAYCKQDTLAMVEVYRALRRL